MVKSYSLETLKENVMEQAKEKGFGTKLSEIMVSEKIALIHSEISEAYDAYLKKNVEGKDGFKEEMGDVLQRILHLGGIFEIEFKEIEVNFTYVSIDEMISKLHLEISEIWESYRHNKEKKFKEKINECANILFIISKNEKFSIEQEVINKIESNKERKWNKKINEKFVN
jgi:NTP pyrophosphatase (non-canonical NTP hydrolase)